MLRLWLMQGLPQNHLCGETTAKLAQRLFLTWTRADSRGVGPWEAACCIYIQLHDVGTWNSS